MSLIQQRILEALLNLQNKPDWYQTTSSRSICDYLQQKMFYQTCHPFTFKNVQTELQQMWIHWPEFSGSVPFPVPGPDGMHPGKAWHMSSRLHYHNRAIPLWSGEYGDSRKSLLKFLIEQLQAA